MGFSNGEGFPGKLQRFAKQIIYHFLDWAWIELEMLQSTGPRDYSSCPQRWFGKLEQQWSSHLFMWPTPSPFFLPASQTSLLATSERDFNQPDFKNKDYLAPCFWSFLLLISFVFWLWDKCWNCWHGRQPSNRRRCEHLVTIWALECHGIGV